MFDIKFMNFGQDTFKDKIFDTIIIGGGPAGLTAAIYTTRYKLSTLLIEKALPGGQMTITEKVENYPGFEEPIFGTELAAKMENQAKKFGMEMITAIVNEIKTDNDIKEVITDGGTYRAKTLILAMGSNPRIIGIPGEIEAAGRGVSYCATCDAPFFRNKEVAVIGGGDAAVEEAIYLTKYASKVTLIHRRDQLRATGAVQDKLFANKNIDILWNTVPTEIDFEDKVKGLKLKNSKSGEESYLKVDGVFMFIGYVPNTKMLKGNVKMDEKGYILTDREGRTNVDGVFACGDVVKKDLYQIATAVGDGAASGFACYKYLFDKE